VGLLIEDEDDDEAMWTLETEAPPVHPNETTETSSPRVSTLDEVIASLPRR
jgi:hypothetical protein